jgi:hypothetical protein
MNSRNNPWETNRIHFTSENGVVKHTLPSSGELLFR